MKWENKEVHQWACKGRFLDKVRYVHLSSLLWHKDSILEHQGKNCVVGNIRRKTKKKWRKVRRKSKVHKEKWKEERKNKRKIKWQKKRGTEVQSKKEENMKKKKTGKEGNVKKSQRRRRRRRRNEGKMEGIKQTLWREGWNNKGWKTFENFTELGINSAFLLFIN